MNGLKRTRLYNVVVLGRSILLEEVLLNTDTSGIMAPWMVPSIIIKDIRQQPPHNVTP